VAAVIHAAGLILQANETVTASIAILLCVRNERPIRIIRNLEALMRRQEIQRSTG
jgi:hypothetical protein